LEKAEEAFNKVLKKRKEEGVELDTRKLLELAPAIIGHVLRLAILEVKGDLKDISFLHIHEIQGKLGVTEKKEIDLPGGIYVFIKKESVIISASKPIEGEKHSFNYLLPVPGETAVKEVGMKISTHILAPGSVALGGELQPHVAYVDKAILPGKLYVRSRRNGDKFSPLGVRGTKKLQDFFVDEKVEEEKRDLVPIVETGEEIVWVAGYRIDEKYKITPKTTSVVQIKAEPLSFNDQ
jgi:tRNA(Ile)-lysidine synthase